MQLDKFFTNPSLYTPYSNNCGFSFRDDADNTQASPTRDVETIVVIGSDDERANLILAPWRNAGYNILYCENAAELDLDDYIESPCVVFVLKMDLDAFSFIEKMQPEIYAILYDDTKIAGRFNSGGKSTLTPQSFFLLNNPVDNQVLHTTYRYPEVPEALIKQTCQHLSPEDIGSLIDDAIYIDQDPEKARGILEQELQGK